MKRFIWLCAVWVVRIVGAPKTMKVSRIKSLYYNINGGYTANQVALYNLTKKNKKEYLSELDWYKSRKVNGKYGELLNNKVKFTNLIKPYISAPEIYCIKEKNNYFNINYEPKDIEYILKTVQNHQETFLKPIDKGKGIGVHKIDYINSNYYIDLEKKTKEEVIDFLERRDNYFLSQAIRQAKYLNEIYDKTSNTIRIITVRENNKVKVLYAVQRFGDHHSIPVDNGSKGGLVSKIDLKNGQLSIAKTIKNKLEYSHHPDSQAVIEGVVIPNFDKIQKKVIEAMKQLSNLKFIAWDLLITDDDIYVIEANASSGVNIIQVFGGQRKGPLGNFYRSNKIIK